MLLDAANKSHREVLIYLYDSWMVCEEFGNGCWRQLGWCEDVGIKVGFRGLEKKPDGGWGGIPYRIYLCCSKKHAKIAAISIHPRKKRTYKIRSRNPQKYAIFVKWIEPKKILCLTPNPPVRGFPLEREMARLQGRLRFRQTVIMTDYMGSKTSVPNTYPGPVKPRTQCANIPQKCRWGTPGVIAVRSSVFSQKTGILYRDRTP